MGKIVCNDSVEFHDPVRLNEPYPEEIRRLPMFFRGDPEYVYRLGGPVYRSILNELDFEANTTYISIDSRIHMLMPGWYPCIPGWHCDDFHRPTNGQPDLAEIAGDSYYRCTHHAVVFGDEAPTEYITSRFDLDLDELDPAFVYRSADTLIEQRQLGTRRLVRPGEIVKFGSFDFHRGTKSAGRGWRLFFRATESNIWEPKNELRTQVQAYLRDTGW